MKKNNYIQPAVEVMAVNAAYTICSESNPFEYGSGSPVDADPV